MTKPLLTNRITIVCGVGGVGKTTVSAALALTDSNIGEKAAKNIVVTMDPAKRLATALGLDGNALDSKIAATPKNLTAQVKEIDPNYLGSFSAMIPDAQSTFDNLLESLSPNPGFKKKVSESRLFKIFSEEFSGANEYMALERLLRIYSSREYDHVVLDTPPSHHLDDFLEAPSTLTSFLQQDLLEWAVKPAGFLFSSGLKKIIELLESLTGAHFMRELFLFFTSLIEVRLGFLARLDQVQTLLKSKDVDLIVVLSPLSTQPEDIPRFVKSLTKHGLKLRGAIMNRSFRKLDPSAAPWILATQEREALLIKSLNESSVELLSTVDEFARDIHDIKDLRYVAQLLISPTGP